MAGTSVKLTALLGVLLAIACARPSPAPHQADAATPTSPGPEEPSASPAPRAPPASESPTATTKLIDAGRAPRRRLRYAWRPDRKEALAVDLRTATSTEVSG